MGWGSVCPAGWQQEAAGHPPELAGFRMSRYRQQPATDKPASPSQRWRTQARDLRVARGLQDTRTEDENHRRQNWVGPGNRGTEGQPRPREGQDKLRVTAKVGMG